MSDIDRDAETVARQVADATGAYTNTRARDIIAAALRGERERCASVARARAEFHAESCRAECKCGDGWHIAAAILGGVK